MRVGMIVVALSTSVLIGCSLVLPVVGVATYPLDKKGKFEAVQEKYTSNLRYGLYDDAKEFVEPEFKARFSEAMDRFKELRLSDYRVESIDMDALRAEAVAVVVFRGYWLSSPYEREIRIVQRWRRELPSQNWLVTPDLDAMITPPGPAPLPTIEPRADVSAPSAL
jgi:hypothetical protein